jgi:hypothetical protein
MVAFAPTRRTKLGRTKLGRTKLGGLEPRDSRLQDAVQLDVPARVYLYSLSLTYLVLRYDLYPCAVPFLPSKPEKDAFRCGMAAEASGDFVTARSAEGTQAAPCLRARRNRVSAPPA